MTREQLAVAEAYRDHHADVFGFDNVRFIEGYIERLDESGLEGDSFDVIVSNCVLNLSPDKDAVLAGAHRLLKDGGEIGRASCRERVCQYVSISVVAVALKTNRSHTYTYSDTM